MDSCRSIPPSFTLNKNQWPVYTPFFWRWVDWMFALQDKWLDVGPNGPSLTNDLKQDWQLIDGRENGTHTTVRVTRAMNTCDPRDRVFTVSMAIFLSFEFISD